MEVESSGNFPLNHFDKQVNTQLLKFMMTSSQQSWQAELFSTVKIFEQLASCIHIYCFRLGEFRTRRKRHYLFKHRLRKVTSERDVVMIKVSYGMDAFYVDVSLSLPS